VISAYASAVLWTCVLHLVRDVLSLPFYPNKIKATLKLRVERSSQN